MGNLLSLCVASTLAAAIALAAEHVLWPPGRAVAHEIDVTEFPPDGDDDAPRFLRAVAHCPADACTLRVPANVSLHLRSPIVIAANRSLAILGDGHATSRLLVAHTGIALTVTQNSQCDTTTISGLRLQGDAAAGGPIAGGIAVDYGTASACAAAPQAIVLEDDEVLAAEDARAMRHPYPGTFVTAISLLGPQPGMVGLLRLNRIGVQPTLSAGPSLPGTSGLALGLVDDIEITNTTFLYAQTAILQTAYLEGLRLSGVTAVGTDHFLTQRAGIARQNGIFLQKMWLHDFEINTYRTAFDVASVSNSFLGGGEIVRYGNSGPDSWAGVDCLDCFGWMGAADLYVDGLVGNPSGAVGLRFRSSGKPNGYHSFVGTRFARLGTAVSLEPGVIASRFLLMQQQDNSGRIVQTASDRSGNATNALSFSDARGEAMLPSASEGKPEGKP